MSVRKRSSLNSARFLFLSLIWPQHRSHIEGSVYYRVVKLAHAAK